MTIFSRRLAASGKGAEESIAWSIWATALPVLGDSDVTNQHLTIQSNTDFLMNGLNFLLEDEALLTIRPKNRQSGLLTLTQKGADSVLSLDVLPVLLLHWVWASSRYETEVAVKRVHRRLLSLAITLVAFLAFAGWVGQEQEELKVEVETESKDAEFFVFEPFDVDGIVMENSHGRFELIRERDRAEDIGRWRLNAPMELVRSRRG